MRHHYHIITIKYVMLDIPKMRDNFKKLKYFSFLISKKALTYINKSECLCLLMLLFETREEKKRDRISQNHENPPKTVTFFIQDKFFSLLYGIYIYALVLKFYLKK